MSETEFYLGDKEFLDEQWGISTWHDDDDEDDDYYDEYNWSPDDDGDEYWPRDHEDEYWQLDDEYCSSDDDDWPNQYEADLRRLITKQNENKFSYISDTYHIYHQSFAGYGDILMYIDRIICNLGTWKSQCFCEFSKSAIQYGLPPETLNVWAQVLDDVSSEKGMSGNEGAARASGNGIYKYSTGRELRDSHHRHIRNLSVSKSFFKFFPTAKVYQNHVQNLTSVRNIINIYRVHMLGDCLEDSAGVSLPNEILLKIINHADNIDAPHRFRRISANYVLSDFRMISEQHPKQSLHKLEQQYNKDLLKSVVNIYQCHRENPYSGSYLRINESDLYCDLEAIYLTKLHKLQTLYDYVNHELVCDIDPTQVLDDNWSNGHCYFRQVYIDKIGVKKAHMLLLHKLVFCEIDGYYETIDIVSHNTLRPNLHTMSCKVDMYVDGLYIRSIILWDFERSRVVSLLQGMFLGQILDSDIDRNEEFVAMLMKRPDSLMKPVYQLNKKKLPYIESELTIWNIETGGLHACMDLDISYTKVSFIEHDIRNILLHGPDAIDTYQLSAESEMLSRSVNALEEQIGMVMCHKRTKVYFNDNGNGTIRDIWNRNSIINFDEGDTILAAAFNNDPDVHTLICVLECSICLYKLNSNLLEKVAEVQHDSLIENWSVHDIALVGDYFAVLYTIHYTYYRIIVGNMKSMKWQPLESYSCDLVMIPNGTTSFRISITNDKLYIYKNGDTFVLICDFSLNDKQMIESDLIEEDLKYLPESGDCSGGQTEGQGE